MTLHHYLYKLLIAVIIMITYYKYIKSFIIYCAPFVTKQLSLTRYFPKSDIEGTIELALIAMSHVLFCTVLITVIPIDWPVTKIKWTFIPIYSLYGILLGIGCMGISGLFCKVAVQVINTIKKDNQYDLKTWLTIARGGWIKHHLQSIEILPIYLSLFILAMQVGSEEVIFRGILLNYFMPFGKLTAFFSAWSLFIVMQGFLMYRWQTALFPMIGATVMGFVHSVLYLQVPLLWPLIIAHITFFLFSVI
jgi:hypothetical protein